MEHRTFLYSLLFSRSGKFYFANCLVIVFLLLTLIGGMYLLLANPYGNPLLGWVTASVTAFLNVLFYLMSYDSWKRRGGV